MSTVSTPTSAAPRRYEIWGNWKMNPGTIEEAIKEYPQIGTMIQTPKGSGRLCRVDIFKEEAVLQYENDEEETFSLEALQELLHSGKKKKNKKRRGGMKHKKKRKEEPSVE